MGDILYDMIKRMNKRAAAEIFNIDSEMEESVSSFKNLTLEIREKIRQAENNYNKPIFPNTTFNKNSSRSSKRIVESSSDEELDVSSTPVKLHNSAENTENNSGKPRRGAAKAASENIKKTSNLKINSKMRRPSHQSPEFNYKSTVVKTEKRSLLEESNKSAALSDVTNDNMPPPLTKPKRGRKKIKKEIEETTERTTRSTRTRTREQPKNHSKSPPRKDSDVLIQEVPVAVVVVTDSESESEKSNKNETNIIAEEVVESSGKSKRGRKPKKQTLNKMKLKIKEEKPTQEEVKNSTQNSLQEVSVYEDALSENKTLDENISGKKTEPIILKTTTNSVLNETHVLNKIDYSPAITEKIRETGVQLNCAVLLEPIVVLNEVPPNLNETKILTRKPIPNTTNNLLTDDDDSIDVSPPTKTPNKKQPVKIKPIFSPYGNSPVKKRVAAFEKLGTSDAPTRVTRTKTRNQATAAEQETPLNTNRVIPPAPPSSSSSQKSKKNYTPLTNNKLPSMIPQSEGKHKLKNTSVTSDSSVKPLTAVKVSRAELQKRREEEQKRKQEHEMEVKRKKDALLLAKIEEHRKKNEEKQLKVQKAREAKEREKEEKIRRIIQEKEEKQQKEEQMKRDWMNTMAKKAAEEEKMQQLLKKEKMEQKRKLNKKPPPLPTDDVQDSDEDDDENEENKKPKYIGPLWSQRQNLYPALYTQRYVPGAITKEFFQMQAQTPDLLEIFETVHADILRRNSSAVWRTPPRYSTLPKF